MTAFRDTVMSALLTHLQTQCGATFATYSRRFVTWEELIQRQGSTFPVAQPALYLFDGVGLGGGETRYEPRGRATPAVVTMDRTIVVYAQIPSGEVGNPDATTPGGTVFYPLEEAIFSAMEQSDSLQENTLTLGGLVSHCWLEGNGVIVTGELDPQGQGMMTLPVRIMLYPFSH